MLLRGQEGATHKQRLEELPKEYTSLQIVLVEGPGAQGRGILHRFTYKITGF